MARFYPSRELGAALRGYRVAIGWTLGDAARHLECDRSKISRIENGVRGIHSSDLTELFMLYEVPLDARASLRGLASVPRGHPDADVLDAVIQVEQASARLMKALAELRDQAVAHGAECRCGHQAAGVIDPGPPALASPAAPPGRRRKPR